MLVIMSLSFKISTPVYKQEEFIETTLLSIKAQKAPFQLAVLDASPDDGSQKIIQKYKSIITYSYHHADEGQSAAIEEGWAHTEGDISAWLNSDDYYFPDTLQKVAQVFESHPEIDVVYGHCVYTRGDGSFSMYTPSIGTNPADLSWMDNIPQPSCFVRTNALKKVGPIKKNLHYTMDWELWLRLRNSGSKFYFLDEILSVACMHENTKTLSGKPERYVEIKNILLANTEGTKKIVALIKTASYNILEKLGAGKFAAHILRHGRKIKQKLSPPKTIVRGLQSWTNKVEKSCEVSLPWYKESGPGRVTVVASAPSGISLTYNGITTEMKDSKPCTISFFTEQIKAYEYTMVIKSTEENVQLFSLQSDNRGWYLYSLHLA